MSDLRKPEHSAAVHSVEFHPSIDDTVYVSLRIGESAYPSPFTVYLYWAFIFLNGVVFPAILMIEGHPLIGAVIFLLNLVAIIFLVPRVNADSNRKFYEKVIGDREDKVARVDIDQEGIRYYTNDSEAFWRWHTIRFIEETDETIYFFIDGNGFGVRKSGFVYRDQEREFVLFAEEKIRSTRALRDLN